MRCVAEGVEMMTPSGIFILQPPNSFFCEYRRFRKSAKHTVLPPRFTPSRQPRKPAKHVVLPPTSILAYNNRRDTCIYTVPSKLRPCDRSNARCQPRLLLRSVREFMSTSAGIPWGDMSWWVACRGVNGGVSLYDEDPPPC